MRFHFQVAGPCPVLHARWRVAHAGPAAPDKYYAFHLYRFARVCFGMKSVSPLEVLYSR